jgi:glyceraldehyde 3-phosphate dehydrogenase
MQGKLDGGAIRVPVPDGSITDFTAVLGTSASVADINAAFRAAADGELKGVLEYSEAPLVSSDIIGNSHSCIFDSKLTMSQGTLVKVSGWYDNEWGYSCRTVDLTGMVGAANRA